MAKRKRHRVNNRREMICISAVVLVLLCVVFVQGNKLKARNVAYAEQIDSLNTQIAQESERAEEIEQLKEDVQTSEYAGRIARERLGMVGEDEILFRKAD